MHLSATFPTAACLAVALAAGTRAVVRSDPRALFTLGLAILMEWGMLEVFGPRVKSIPVFIEGEADLGPVTVSLNDVALVILAVVIIVALWTFLNRSSLGRAMRAVATSVSGARIVGIDIDRIYGATFALAFGVTAISGVLLHDSDLRALRLVAAFRREGQVLPEAGHGIGKRQTESQREPRRLEPRRVVPR